MTANRARKRAIRAHMADTGASYTRARNALTPRPGADPFRFTFGTWLDDDSPATFTMGTTTGPGVLLTGIPGCGKSVVAQHLTEQFVAATDPDARHLVYVDPKADAGRDWDTVPGAVWARTAGPDAALAAALAIEDALASPHPALVVLEDAVGYWGVEGRHPRFDAALQRLAREGRARNTRFVVVEHHLLGVPDNLNAAAAVRVLMGWRSDPRTYQEAAWGDVFGAHPAPAAVTDDGPGQGWVALPGKGPRFAAATPPRRQS